MLRPSPGYQSLSPARFAPAPLMEYPRGPARQVKVGLKERLPGGLHTRSQAEWVWNPLPESRASAQGMPFVSPYGRRGDPHPCLIST